MQEQEMQAAETGTALCTYSAIAITESFYLTGRGIYLSLGHFAGKCMKKKSVLFQLYVEN